MSRTRFVFCLHFHQPVGNLASVIQRIVRDCYHPLLDALERNAPLPLTVHISGSLLEWLESHEPGILVRLRRLGDAGGWEWLGGAFYEPILAAIPEEDAVEQIRRHRDTLEKAFEAHPRGIWLAERVWEPPLASLLGRLGFEYTLLDDHLFRASGMQEDELDGYFLTDDRGGLLRIFVIREALRMRIPFAAPEEAADWIASRPRRIPSPVVVFADDAEKFGHWPATARTVHEERWLDRFFAELRRRADEIELTTPSGILAGQRPQGRVYLGSGSYREMCEWASLGAGGSGTWRNFLAKYPEALVAYGRMLDVSRRVREMNPRSSARRSAVREVLRAQCSCPYWHGLFGGIYLPHLRDALFRHLIRAQNATEDPDAWGCEEADFDLDGEPDLRLYAPEMNLWVCPSRGGQVIGWDVRPLEVNLGAVLARRPERYHEGAMRYDDGPLFSLRERFRNVSGAFEGPEIGTFASGRFSARAQRSDRGAAAELEGRGAIGGKPAVVRKRLVVMRQEPEWQIEYEIETPEEACEFEFGVDFAIAVRGEEWAVRLEPGGPAVEAPRVRISRGIWIEDRLRRITLSCFFSEPCGLAWERIETVFRTEQGTGRTLQGILVQPYWRVATKPGAAWRGVITWRVHRAD